MTKNSGIRKTKDNKKKEGIMTKKITGEEEEEEEEEEEGIPLHFLHLNSCVCEN